VHDFRRGGVSATSTPYWQPRETGAFSALSAAAEALRAGLVESVRASCTGSERVGVLLSGGEDSRAVLAAVPPAAKAEAFTYAEWESREVRIARAAAQAYGAELRVGLRPADHYVAGFEHTARLLGSGHLFIDVHGFGLHARLGLDTLPMVLGGLSADSLLKATYAPRRARPFRTPRLPHLRADLLQDVDARRNAFLASLRELRPHSANEWLQLWPFSMRKHGGNVDGNRRLFRVHEAFHATAVLDVAAAAPVGWKRHRRLYQRALQPLFEPSRQIPHADYAYPYHGWFGNLLRVPGLAVTRGVRGLAKGELRVRHRPWPRWHSLLDDPVMQSREQTLLDSALLAALLDVAPGTARPGLARWPALPRLLLLQLAHVTGDQIARS